ncbi:MAG: putative selenate reductase subunit YgfK [Candidatus Riflebacteria bacterium]|nr:putative selenate reductase subunit YgfK [Candidatus Riflebacteria bacterium]
MSKDFSLISVAHLFSSLKKDFEQKNEMLGIPASLFFKPSANDTFRMKRYDQVLETPLGVAAGPHTQMAQNIIAAWLCGARYIELKTVQTLDELNVSKPCIDMQDEGYNCEWSQELKLTQSFEEYLNAWIIIHLLKDMLGQDNKNGLGCIFNMSVGYNMEGILKENVQTFFSKMASCRKEKDSKIDTLAAIYPHIRQINIPNCISNNVTLSTMHGCPPDEIEKIGRYLIEEKKLHTTVKLNPTLLGAQELRKILNEKLGFVTNVPDEAFGHDVKYPDALKIIKNLKESSLKNGVDFSLKLTNTLESVNHKPVFPENEKMMYMSGRALHPVSINVAKKLQCEFKGELDISFCAGIDCFNVSDILATGMKPLTVCSDILKPGGYMRIKQYLDNISNDFKKYSSGNIDSFIIAKNEKKSSDVKAAALANLQKYAEKVSDVDFYKNEFKKGEHIKTSRKLESFDCISAPCEQTCPVNQDIPQYLYLTSLGKYDEALEVIRKTNPLPNICGMVCDHTCQGKCTRQNYDQPVMIREVKRFLSQNENEKKASQSHSKQASKLSGNSKKVAIIGAGPSGLSCAYFLALNGFSVTVFETKSIAGGMVSEVIPAFRIKAEAINKDIEHIKKLGVDFKFGHNINKDEFEKIRKEFDIVYIATGAQKTKKMGIPGEDHPNCRDFLDFLSKAKHGEKIFLKKKVLVLGGGNSAMDVARTAKRLIDKDGEVIVVYRRTISDMPADREEIEALAKEGIPVMPLTAPSSIHYSDGRLHLKCYKMKQGEKDSSGRARPEKIEGSEFEIAADFIIPAIGQESAIDFMNPSDITADAVTRECKLKNVFIGGDLYRGPSTVIKAISDGKAAAWNISRLAGVEEVQHNQKDISYSELIQKRAVRILPEKLSENFTAASGDFSLVTETMTEKMARTESERCLFCDEICNICVTVCPNRANIGFQIQPSDYIIYRAVSSENEKSDIKIEKSGVLRISQKNQVANVGDFCNECGNCTTFCPTSGSPFMEKTKFYLTDESFSHEENGFRFSKNVLLHKVAGKTLALSKNNGMFEFSDASSGILAHFDEKTLELKKVLIDDKKAEFNSTTAAKMAVLYNSLANHPLLNF